jgi:hypothetical protein
LSSNGYPPHLMYHLTTQHIERRDPFCPLLSWVPILPLGAQCVFLSWLQESWVL